LFEVLFGAAGLRVKGIGGGHRLDFAIETDGLGLRGDLPLGSAKENADVPAVYRGDTRGNGFGFEGMIDGREDDGSVGNVNDGAAAGEIGDDFVFLGADEGSQSRQQKENRGASEEFHKSRVA